MPIQIFEAAQHDAVVLGGGLAGRSGSRRENLFAMVERLVLVNGLPASGKTTLATQLAAHLSIPLVSKDTIKELLADAFPAAAADSLGRIAMETAWSLVAEMPGTAILESWWFKPRDLGFVKAGLERCCAARVVEIWCDVPADMAHRRFQARDRHAVHQDARRLASCWDDWIARAEPLDVGLTLRVRTDQPVDVGPVAVAVLGGDTQASVKQPGADDGRYDFRPAPKRRDG